MDPITVKTCKSTPDPLEVKLTSSQPILVYFKPGLVCLWSAPHSPGFWSGSLSFRVRTQKISASSSSLHPVSGVSYVEKYDMLVFSLQDGSFHVIYSLSAQPTLEPPNDALATAESLSAMSRAVYTRSEEKPVRKTDMEAVNGMVSYDGGQTFTWVYECVTCIDFTLPVFSPY